MRDVWLEMEFERIVYFSCLVFLTFRLKIFIQDFELCLNDFAIRITVHSGLGKICKKNLEISSDRYTLRLLNKFKSSSWDRYKSDMEKAILISCCYYHS